MSDLFLKILSMSLSVLWLVPAVLLLRLALKRSPKWIHVLLWAMVAVRLVCPFSFESSLSLIPESVSTGAVLDNWTDTYVGTHHIIHDVSPNYQAAVDAGRTPISSGGDNYYVVTGPDGTSAPDTVKSTRIPVYANIWLAGMVVMALYTFLSYAALRRKVSAAVRLKGNIYQSEAVGSPFVLGLIRPRIYLPFSLSENDLYHVVAHEKAHIRRKDHWWKPLGFLVLTIHWFNPVVWLSYILLCRDIELACDEKVIMDMGSDQQADYSQALLNCSVHRRGVAACPLAFGEVGVKQRVSNILNYRKPAFWVILIAAALCIVVAVCFLTNPVEADKTPFGQDWYTERFLYLNADVMSDTVPSPDGNYTLNSEQIDVLLYAHYQLERNGSFSVMEAPETGTWALLGQFKEEKLSMLNFDEYFKQEDMWSTELYRPEKFRETYVNAWRLDVNPHGPGLFYLLLEMEDSEFYLMCGYDEASSHAAQEEASAMYWVTRLTAVAPADARAYYWFDHLENGTYPQDTTTLELTIPAFPDVTFEALPGEIRAVKDGESTVLISGMPIWNAFLCDLTGDGIPEICATVSHGSGIIDEHVVVFDYAAGTEFTLWDRGVFDYTLRLVDRKLICDKWFYPHEDIADSGELILVRTGGGEGMRLELNSDTEKEEPEMAVSFETFDFSSVTDIKLSNAHNGKSTAISDTESIQAICAFLSGVSGSNPRNSKGRHYQGTYALTLLAEDETVLQITFGDEDVFFYGMYDETYSMMYDLEWYTVDDIIHYFYHFDESGFDWGFEETMVAVDVDETPYEITSTIPQDGLRADIEYLTPGDVTGYGFLKEERFELAVLLNNLMPEAFEAPVAYTPTMKVNLSWDGGRLTLYSDGKQTVFGEDGDWAVRTEDLNRFLSRFYSVRDDYDTVNHYALDELPPYYNQEQAMIDDCVGFLDFDVHFGSEHFAAFAESVYNGVPATVRIAFYSSEEPYATSISDITYDGEAFLWQSIQDGQLYERSYRYLRHFTGEAETANASYDAYDAYVLTDDPYATWTQLWNSLYSSQAGVAIDFLTVYNDFIYYPDHPVIPDCEKVTLELDGNILLTVTETNALEELFANAEALGYEPKTYFPGPALRFIRADGSDLAVTLTLDSDLFILNGTFYDFGPGYDDDGSLNALPQLFDLLGIENWPDAVLDAYPDYF